MIFGKTKMELKLGIFIFINLVILSTFILSIGNFRAWTSRYNGVFIYNFVNGIKLGAPVRFAGVDVGEVKNICFYFNPEEQKTKVEVTCSVKKEVKIPLDSTVWVNTLGLLGEKYIEIIPGEDYDNILANNQKMVGVDPIAMHDVTRLAQGIGQNVNESIERLKNKEGTIGKLLYEDKIYNELDALITDIRKNPWKLFRKTKEKK
ncbi:MAG: MlaD family protein [Candidatus Omnitrophica bacterium]|nr:MlaD family protein [Candidatus Omnitrophota bacterium]